MELLAGLFTKSLDVLLISKRFTKSLDDNEYLLVFFSVVS